MGGIIGWNNETISHLAKICRMRCLVCLHQHRISLVLAFITITRASHCLIDDQKVRVNSSNSSERIEKSFKVYKLNSLPPTHDTIKDVVWRGDMPIVYPNHWIAMTMVYCRKSIWILFINNVTSSSVRTNRNLFLRTIASDESARPNCRNARSWMNRSLVEYDQNFSNQSNVKPCLRFHPAGLEIRSLKVKRKHAHVNITPPHSL